MDVVHYALTTPSVICVPLFVLFRLSFAHSHIRANLLRRIRCFGSSVVTIISVTHFSGWDKFFGFCTDGSDGSYRYAIHPIDLQLGLLLWNTLFFTRMAPMAHTDTPFIRLTCNLGYFFEILYSSHVWHLKIFYLGEGMGLNGHWPLQKKK